MVKKDKLIADEFAKNLIKISEERDNYNLVGRLLENMFEEVTNDARHREIRDNLTLGNNPGLRKLQNEVCITVVNGIFDKLEKRSKLKNLNKISAEEIVESSGKPIPMFCNNNATKKSRAIDKIASSPSSLDDMVDCFKDDNNHHFESIPLHKVICRATDRKIMFHASTIRLPEDEQQNGKQYAYEFGWVTNCNLDENKQIVDEIEEYLNLSFVNESGHIKRLLARQSTTVLMILNVENISDNKITVSNIVSLIMFGNDDMFATCVDFIATSLPYTGMNFGPFLLHTAQIFGSKAIEQKSNGSIKDNYTTVLACRMELIPYYKRLGFIESPKDIFDQNGDLEKSGKRFEVDNWSQLSEEDLLFPMRTNTLCSRIVNYLSFFPIDLESTIYNEEDPFPQWENISSSNEVSEKFGLCFQELIEQKKYFLFSADIEGFVRQSNTMTSKFERLYKAASEIKIGKFYRTVMEYIKMSQKDNVRNDKTSHLFEEAIYGLSIVCFFQKIETGEYDNQECWVMVKCAYCNKHVYVKKQKDDYFNEFMNQVVLSTWFVHIFGLENLPDNEWYKCNCNWNVCKARKGFIFNKLKMAQAFDNESMTDPSKYDGYYRSYIYLEGLWEQFDSFFFKLFEEICKMLFIIQDHINVEDEKGTRESRSYAERQKELLKIIAPDKNRNNEDDSDKEYRKQKNLSNRQKNKRIREVKRQRHEEEHVWNEVFAKDLKLQLKFKFIEYVDLDSRQQLNSVSKKYIDNERKERRNKRNKKNKSTEEDDNHFLMYESLESTPHVIDEEWFENRDDTTGAITQRLTQTTVLKCVEKPNHIHKLSTADLRLIKSHVRKIQDGTCIHSLKRVKTKTIDQEEEVVNYKGNISSSKYSFIGYDKNRHEHKISMDWVELNFKNKHPNVFRNIMTLQTGKTYNIPPGSKNLEELGSSQFQITRDQIRLIGPFIHFMQNNDPSCLVSSLSSALVYIGEDAIAGRLMNYYKLYRTNETSIAFGMNNVLDVTMYNKGRKKGEPRWKCTIQKITNTPVLSILNDKQTNILYHVVLNNHHAIVLCEDWIFDSTLERAIPRDELHLRYCAESYDTETTSSIIKRVYKYSWSPQKNYDTPKQI